MLRILLAIILERMLAEAVERDAAQIPRRNDPVGVDVVEQQRHAGAGDGFNSLHDNSQTLDFERIGNK